MGQASEKKLENSNEGHVITSHDAKPLPKEVQLPKSDPVHEPKQESASAHPVVRPSSKEVPKHADSTMQPPETTASRQEKAEIGSTKSLREEHSSAEIKKVEESADHKEKEHVQENKELKQTD